MKPQADIGIFGGSGLYELLDDVEEIWVETPYGAPSDKVALATVGKWRVAFLPRHGKDHRYPPHRINYRANVWAMKELGVQRILGPCAAGSLKKEIRPGDIVVSDQFVHRTWGREDTFFDGPVTIHVSAADPYCPQLRSVAIECAKEAGFRVHERGTIVVIQGPRFSTRAESNEFRAHGWDVVNMTQYPEAYLARELGICYVNLALVTDYDSGLDDDPDVEPVAHADVLRVFQRNIDRLRSVLQAIVNALTEEKTCGCARALEGARG